MTDKTVANLSLLPRCQVEKAKPELLPPALTAAMSHFAGDSEEGLSPSSPSKRRRRSVQLIAALSRRRLELEATPASITHHSFLRLKIRSFISRLHVRTSSSASVAPELPPNRWMQIWLLLVEDPDDAVREVARQARQTHAGPCTQPAAHSLRIAGCLTPHRFHVRWQAFTSNPQRILTHARWLVEQLQSNTDSSCSTAKAEVLRLFATLQARPPPL